MYIDNYKTEYDPFYGDDKMCICGHTYKDHFPIEPKFGDKTIGCFYSYNCDCKLFERFILSDRSGV